MLCFCLASAAWWSPATQGMGWRSARVITLISDRHTLECHSLTQACRWWVQEGCLLVVNNPPGHLKCTISFPESQTSILCGMKRQRLQIKLSLSMSIYYSHRMTVLPWKLGGSRLHLRTRFMPRLLQCLGILLSFMPHRYSFSDLYKL